jgi:pimeloyl-ACP methyl ester carboxylesterase
MNCFQTSSTELIVQANNLEFWTEAFGNCENPPIILIMGLGAQGVMWPFEFCENLAGQGYYVVRFDHRDVGLSTLVNFEENPYNLLDMAKDILSIMDYYRLEKVHFVGASMGGLLAMLMGAHYPERTRSLTLMMTTSDIRPAIEAFQGIQTQSILPPPHPRVLEQANKMLQCMPETFEEKLELFVNNFRINSGSIPVDEILCRELAASAISRMKNLEPGNDHMKAIIASYDLCAAAQEKVDVPTLIIHGDEDPILPLAHAHALKDAIKNSTLQIVPGLGHCLMNRQFFEPVIREIVACAKSADVNLKLHSMRSMNPYKYVYIPENSYQQLWK